MFRSKIFTPLGGRHQGVQAGLETWAATGVPVLSVSFI